MALKHSRYRRFAEGVGWVAVVLSLILYLLASFGFLPADTAPSLILNIIGCAGMVYVGWHQKAPQSIAVNVVWGLIALSALLCLLIRHR